MSRLAVLSVHYLLPELLADQVARLAACTPPLLRRTGLSLNFHPIVHRFARDEVARGVLETDGGLDLRDRPLDVIPRGGRSHGHSLAEAFRTLRRTGALENGDLVAFLDHDAHPLDTRLFAALASALVRTPEPLGLGIPHWHDGLCYLHPSLLLSRVETLERIGIAAACEVRLPATAGDGAWADTCEGFTAWGRERGLPLLPLRVCSTMFPWDWWDGGATARDGWHGEPVRHGHLMRYGLEQEKPLVSHVWAGALGPYRSLGLSQHTREEVLAAYLAEPLESAA